MSRKLSQPAEGSAFRTPGYPAAAAVTTEERGWGPGRGRGEMPLHAISIKEPSE